MSDHDAASLELQANDLLLAAFLGELHGARPSADLVERIVARATRHGARRRAPARHVWLVAALLLAGVGVVVAAALRHPRPAQRPAVPPPEHAQDPPPAPDRDPEQRRRIEQAIRTLELPDQRGAAMAELARIGSAVLPLLEVAQEEETRRGRAEIASVLAAARLHVSRAAAKAAFGLPAVPVTLAADYADNRIVAVDQTGKEVWALADVFGVWDAELTAVGTLLITEFSISRVREIDRTGKVLFAFEDLKNPYDADRLANGNTLIADTFAGRVIEVDRTGKVVWTYADGIRPFDCDRLADGSTLIADALGERVLEVDRAGTVVWQLEEMALCHDADRLLDGNTLITLRDRKRVIEVDRSGKVVFELRDLNHPSDADRLPNGNTLVAENAMVREFDRAGNEVWRHKVPWAVEAGRY